MFKNLNWGHGIAIALGTFIAFILFLIFLFPISQQDAELVSDSYYEDEINYQKVIDGKKNASQLSIQPQYSQAIDGIKIEFPNDNTIDLKRIEYFLYRTENSNLDVKKAQVLNENNCLFIPKNNLSPGSYTLKISWTQNKIPYQIDYDVLWK